MAMYGQRGFAPAYGAAPVGYGAPAQAVARPMASYVAPAPAAYAAPAYGAPMGYGAPAPAYDPEAAQAQLEAYQQAQADAAAAQALKDNQQRVK